MDRCRLCYCETNSELSESIFNENHYPPIWKIIEEISNLTIMKNDPYTKLVCLQCLEELKKIDIFRNMILYTDWRIRHDNYNNHRHNDKDVQSPDLINTNFNDANNLLSLQIKTETLDCVLKQEPIEIEGGDSVKIENDSDENCYQKPISDNDEMMIKDINEINLVEVKGEPIDTQYDNRNNNNINNNNNNNDNNQYKFPQINNTLQTHPRIHTNDDIYNCNYCGQRFTLMGSLKRHLLTHTGEKPYHCDICGHRFTQSGNLQAHLRIHTGEKSFICSVCNRGFSHKNNLKLHLRVHTGEKPYCCDVCGQKFSRQFHLKRHLEVHTGAKPFTCFICNRSYSQKDSLKRHLIVHESEKQMK